MRVIIMKNKWIDRWKSLKWYLRCGKHYLRVWFTMSVIFIFSLYSASPKPSDSLSSWPEFIFCFRPWFPPQTSSLSCSSGSELSLLNSILMSSRCFVSLLLGKCLPWSGLAAGANTCPLTLTLSVLCGPLAHRWMEPSGLWKGLCF